MHFATVKLTWRGCPWLLVNYHSSLSAKRRLWKCRSCLGCNYLLAQDVIVCDSASAKISPIVLELPNCLFLRRYFWISDYGNRDDKRCWFIRLPNWFPNYHVHLFCSYGKREIVSETSPDLEGLCFDMRHEKNIHWTKILVSIMCGLRTIHILKFWMNQSTTEVFFLLVSSKSYFPRIETLKLLEKLSRRGIFAFDLRHSRTADLNERDHDVWKYRLDTQIDVGKKCIVWSSYALRIVRVGHGSFCSIVQLRNY